MDLLSMRFAHGGHDHNHDNDQDTISDDASSITDEKKGSISRGSTEADLIDGIVVRRSKLLDLPQELFDGITSYLGPAHIAILALVNRELFARFLRVQSSPTPSLASPDSGTPDISQSWKVLGEYVKASDTTRFRVRGSLLSILDTDVLDLVYCYKCKTMHDPFVTFKDRVYSPQKSFKCVDYSYDHHLPPRATRKMLRTITKRRKRDEPYKHLMQQVNHTTTTYKNGILVQDSVRMRFRGESLLLRRRQFVSPVNKTPLAMWNFKNQLVNPAATGHNSTTNPKVVRICNHLVWIEQYQAMMENLIDPLCQTSPPPAGHLHQPTCFGNNPFHISMEVEGEDDAATSQHHIIARRFRELETGVVSEPSASPLGDVRGCEKCTTDFSMDVVKLPEPFTWGFVLTTWLDLGHKDFCSKWNSHRHLTPPRPYERTPLKSRHGSICENFENIKVAADETATRADYRPKINELDRERMTNYGWGERASQGRGKYAHWSIGCAVDPATGWIMDPDPLESDDE